MYFEEHFFYFLQTREEMKQLLESIAHINAAKQIGTRHFESHIIFDGGIKGNTITNKALQLLGLVPEVLRTYMCRYFGLIVYTVFDI